MVTGYIYKCELARAPFQLYQKHFVKKRSKGGFHIQRRTWRPRALNCLFTVKTNSNTKDSLFLKKKSSKNPARGPEWLWYIERVLFHLKAYFPILPWVSESQRNSPSPRKVGESVGLFTVLFLNVWVIRNYSCCVVRRRARLIWMIPSDDKISTNIIYKD